MTKQEIIKSAQMAIDDAMGMAGEQDKDWLMFYLGKAWAYLDVALGGEKEEP